MRVDLLVEQASWLAIPVIVTGIAHMFVVRAGLFAGLAKPIDGGATLGGQRIFGDNKTWRGVAVMVAGTSIAGALMGLFWGRWAQTSGVAPIPFAVVGARLGLDGALGLAGGYAFVHAVLGLGYVLGELPNSFLKRRLRITPGRTANGLIGGLFFLLDQADSVVAALGFAVFFFHLSWQIFCVGIFGFTALHLALNAALYAARVRRNL